MKRSCAAWGEIVVKRPALSSILLFCGLLAFSARPSTAQLTGHDEGEEWIEEGRQELCLFLGISSKESEAGFSVGLDYEYRLSRLFGIGALAEYTGADFRDGLLGVTFTWHAWQELKLVGAPSVEIDPAERSDAFVFRLGGEYAIPVRSGIEIAPALYFDISSEDLTVVAGAGVAKGF
jgi:hypothetical protein